MLFIFGGQQHQHDLIRVKLRLLGGFIKAVKEINTYVTDMTSVIDPKMYDQIADFNGKSRNYGSPSTAYAIGAELKKVAAFYIDDCITSTTLQKRKQKVVLLSQ